MFARLNQWFQRHFSDPQVAILALFLVLVLACMLVGAVFGLERVGANRLVAVVGVFAGFLGVLFSLLFGLVPMVSRLLAAIVRGLSSCSALAQEWVAQLPARYPQLVAP